ncbi:MAG: 4Fe-4S single cluster domain-containing protein [Treponema sp.]
MNIAHIEAYSFIYGPGCRSVIWTQGCSIRCPGCWNKNLWDFTPNKEILVSDLVSRILKQKTFIEGITILGGEPFDQYTELFKLCKALADENLSLIVYSGYEKQVLIDKGYAPLFHCIDVLISGPYIESLRSMELGLIGSSNQRTDFFTNRYSAADLVKTNEIEISFTDTGSMQIYGYPDTMTMDVLFSAAHMKS